jgi:prepilin-type N-terminal cleavage/methylation domain-containing protein
MRPRADGYFTAAARGGSRKETHVLATVRRRLAVEQSGFTMLELLVVMIILANLMAIAIPSYLTIKTRAQQQAAKANVRDAAPAVIAYGSDNTGTASDVDANASTTGYAGMTLALLQTYDGRVKNIRIQSTSTSTFCIDSTVGTYIYKKAGPAADIVSGTCP